MTTPKKLNPFLSYLIFVLVFILLCFVYGAIVVTFGISQSQIHRIILPPIIFVLSLCIRNLIVAAINKKTNQNCIQADIAAQKASTAKETAPAPCVESPMNPTIENADQTFPAAPAPESHPTSEPIPHPAHSTDPPVVTTSKIPKILHVYILALLLLLASISAGIFEVNNTLSNIDRTIDNFSNSYGTTDTDGIEKRLDAINDSLNNAFFR